MALMRTRITAPLCLVFAIVTACSCSDENHTVSVDHIEIVELRSLTGPYVECDDDEAEHMLVIRVTVLGELDGRRFQIPFCRAERTGGPVHGPTHFCAAGPDGGLSGSVVIKSSTDTTVSVHVDLLWTSPRTKGELDEDIVIPIGKPGIKELPNDRQIEWEFDAPNRAKDQAQPA